MKLFIGDFLKIVIIRKDKVEEVSFVGEVIIMILEIMIENRKNLFFLEIILERIKEGDISKDDVIVKVENLEDLSKEDVEDILEEKLIELLIGKLVFLVLKSFVKVWGEVKVSLFIESRFCLLD